MQISNETPFAVDTLFWEDLQGKAKLTVVVKATFEIHRGKASIRSDQLPVFSGDQHYRDDPLAPVLYESDRVPFKPRADIVLVGRAHAPLAKPIPLLDVSLRVGSLQKVVRVFGNRKWRCTAISGGVPFMSTPEPFATMDLTYERSYGGIDASTAQYCPENPAGAGFIGDNSKEPIDGKPLPNLEDPRRLIQSPEDRAKPAGFGFYGRGWLPRLKYAGTYDEKYQKEQAPALPADFSYALFNGAHPDLQIDGYLRGDEPVELANLSPESRLKFSLPAVRPKVSVKKWKVAPDEWIEQQAADGREVTLDQVPVSEESIGAHFDTLVLMPDDSAFYQVFRGVCDLKNLDDLEVAGIKITL